MHPFLNTAVKAARKAGNIIARSSLHEKPLDITLKGENDYVTHIDHAAEFAIIDTLRYAYPDHAILAEESGQIGDLNADHLWIIDPLDGTANFIRGLPQFTVSIALQINGRLEHAVVYHPLTQDLYTATRGSGATLNDKRIRISNRTKVSGSLFSAGIPHEHDKIQPFDQVIDFMKKENCILRRSGSTALDLAYVGSGALEAFWAIGAKPWDVAAGALIVREAGGIVTDLNGGEDYLMGGNILAASPKLIKQILPAIRSQIS